MQGRHPSSINRNKDDQTWRAQNRGKQKKMNDVKAVNKEMKGPVLHHQSSVILSCVMRNPDFYLCENKGADQLWRSAPLFSLHR